jgi:hypothetical protein
MTKTDTKTADAPSAHTLRDVLGDGEILRKVDGGTFAARLGGLHLCWAKSRLTLRSICQRSAPSLR